MILEQIAKDTKIRVERQKEIKSFQMMKASALALPVGDFLFEKTIKNTKGALICEVKKASPSKGIISESFPYIEIAKIYEQEGANCISVLTEPKWFLGSDDIFCQIRAEVKIPMLRKDFTIDPYQIYEAKVMGADAVLLICALLDTKTIKEYLQICDTLGISALVETHNEEEICSAKEAGARLIGVNNRNLKDFSVNLKNAYELKHLVSDECIFVAESGILLPKDGIELLKNGADALLIGEALMRTNWKGDFIQAIRKGIT